MITVITILYIGCVLVAFKVIKIPVRAGTVATAVVLGVVILGGIVIGWKQAAPMTQQMFLKRDVLQIIPDLRESISKIHVKADQKVKKGDVLFQIDPRSFQYTVDQSLAELKASQQTVSQLEAGVKAADAAVKKSEADTAAAKAEVEAAKELEKINPGAISKVRLVEKEQAYVAAQADDKRVEAAQKEAGFALAAAQNAVVVAAAALQIASFDLQQCQYRAPADGQVINWQIREGTMATRWKFTSMGTFMEEGTAVGAVFPQNLLNNVKPGDAVDIAFKSMPGEIVTGKVDAVVNYTGEGQFVPTGVLPQAWSVGSKGKLVVRIRLDDDKTVDELPLGAAGSVAIYTDFGKPFHVISKITVRIKGWMYYLPI